MPAALQANDYWIIATAVCCNVACAAPGTFLVLRRMSLLGDAISHAVLPGLVGAFLLWGTRSAPVMLLGAMAVGVLTAFLSALLHRWGRVPEDASMGVVFTSLFALGVLLITRYASSIDLDPGCVLYGLIEFVPLDRVDLFGWQAPRATLVLAAVMAVNLLLIALFFKELAVVSFDPQLAQAMGISTGLVHYGLMALVAATTVAAFESVGSILVVAMLSAPGATAHLLSDRLWRVLVIAVLSAATSAVIGYLAAAHPAVNTSVAGMISVAAGVQFTLAVFFAPRHGYVSKVLHRWALARRIVREDILGLLYRWRESAAAGLGYRQVLAALGGGWLPRWAVWSLRRRGLVRVTNGQRLDLTGDGEHAARGLVRSHRLWESYLAKYTKLPLDHLHSPATRMEHFVDERLRGELENQLQTRSDPHGREIPRQS